MPITYDKARDIWNLTDPTEDEKASLLKIAQEEIVGFFGDIVAQRVMALAKNHFMQEEEQEDDELENMDKEKMFNA